MTTNEVVQPVLSGFSKEDLERELARREEEEKQCIINQRREKFAAIIRNRESLLDLIGHSRTSCSDENVVNGLFSGPRCVRCALLELDELTHLDYDFQLGISFYPIKD